MVKPDHPEQRVCQALLDQPDRLDQWEARGTPAPLDQLEELVPTASSVYQGQQAQADRQDQPDSQVLPAHLELRVTRECQERLEFLVSPDQLVHREAQEVQARLEIPVQQVLLV